MQLIVKIGGFAELQNIKLGNFEGRKVLDKTSLAIRHADEGGIPAKGNRASSFVGVTARSVMPTQGGNPDQMKFLLL